MPKTAFIHIVVIIGFIIVSTGCKNQLIEPDLSSPIITDFSVEPSKVSFSPLDGIQDTTMIITVNGHISGDPEAELSGFSAIKDDVILFQGEFTLTPEPNTSSYKFSAEFPVTLNTTGNQTVNVVLFSYNAAGEGERIFTAITFQGFATQAPELISVTNPDSVTIPPTGVKEIRFEAKAVHPVGQQLMDGVFIYLVDSKSNRIPSDGSSFRLFDDGVKDVPSGKDDSVAADSVYTLILAIDSGNSPDVYNVFWYPKDQAGLIGDTLQTELRIVEP